MATQKDFRIKNGLIVQNGNTTVSQGTVSIADQISGDTGQLTITNGQSGSSFMRIGIIGSGTANSHIRTDSTLEFHIGQSATSATPSVSIDTSGNITSTGVIKSSGSDSATSGQLLNLTGSSVNQTNSGTIRLTERSYDASPYFQGSFIKYDGSSNQLKIGVHHTSDNNLNNDTDVIRIDRSTGFFKIVNGGLYISNTEVITTNRNLTNIGTISSGAITSTSSITANSGGNVIQIGTDGNIEITRTSGGAYIDFKDSSSEDYDQRLQATSTGHSFSGTISNSAFTIPNSIGTAGQVLKVPSTGTTLEWVTDTSGAVTSISNNVDNRILTATGGTTINGETNLSFNGSTLTVNADADFNGANADLQWDSSADSLIFNDNAKATFGTGSDLQIYHSGSNSIIRDVGTGDLRIQGANLQLLSSNGKKYLFGVEDAYTKLYYNNAEKLATTSTGIDVTGTVTSTGNIFMSTNGSILRNSGGALQLQSDASQVILRSNNTTALTLDTSQNAIFAGTISSDAITSTGLTVSTASSVPTFNIITTHPSGIPILNLKGAASAQIRYQDENGNNQSRIDFDDAGAFNFIDATDGSSHLLINSSGNATFAGTISSSSITATVNNYQLRLRRADSADDDWKFYSWESGLNIFPASASSVFFGRDGASTDVSVYNGNLKIGTTTVIDSSRNLTNIGTISSGKITTSGTGTAGLPTLDIINSSSSTYNHSIEAMTPNLTTGESNILVFGREGSTKNSGYIGYKYSSAGSNDNVITLGHWSSNHLVTINGVGNTTFAGTIDSGAITSTGIITSADFFKATGQNIKFSAGGTHVLNMDVNRKIYPATNNSTDLGHSGTLAFRTLYLTNSIYHNTSQILDSSRNLSNIGTISSGDIRVTGSTNNNTADALRVDDSGNAALFRVRNDGVVLVSDNYFYVNSSQGAYFDGQVRFRNGITDDTGQLSINSSTGDIYFNSADLEAVGTISSARLIVNSGANVSQFHSHHTTGHDDWQVSPISIRERGLNTNNSTNNQYSPNLNFHWASVVSRSLTMTSDGNFTLGEWTSSGSPEMSGNLSFLNTAGYRVNNTNVIDSSRNLTNIGSITATDNIVTSGAYTTLGSGASNYGVIRVTNPKGADRFSRSGNETGAIKITLPVSWTSTMLRFTVKVYDYTQGESFEVVCAGYNYASGAQWINTSAYIINQPNFDRDFVVKFGHDGTKCAVYIGTTSSTWTHSQIAVTDFQAGFNQASASSWADGWDIDIVTTLGTISQTINNTSVTDNARRLKVGGTEVITNSRNLTNIGTISAGVFTTNANTGTFSNSIGTFPLVTSTPYDYVAKFESTDSGAAIIIEDNNSTSNGNRVSVSGDTMSFFTSATSALTLDASQNATFAGTISSGAITSSGNIAISAGNKILLSGAGDNTHYIYHDSSTDYDVVNYSTGFQLEHYSSGTQFTLVGSTGNATFTGGINSGALSVNSGTANIAATFQSTDGIAGIKLQDSSGNVELSASGSTFRVQPSGGTPVLEINSSGTNTVTIDGTGTKTLRSYHDSGGVGWATGSGTSYTNLLYLDDNNDRVRIYTEQVERLRINATGVDATTGGFRINATTVIDSARNLTNIGTISSGDITTSGDLYLSEYVYHTGDTDTYIRIQDNSWTFRTGGGDRVVIDNSEMTTKDINVGGTGNATVKVRHIEGKAPNSASYEALYLNYNSTYPVFIGQSASNSDLYLYGALRIGSTAVIDASRNMSNIGTISSGAITTSGYFHLNASHTVYAGAIDTTSTATTSYNVIRFRQGTGSGAPTGLIGTAGSAVNNTAFRSGMNIGTQNSGSLNFIINDGYAGKFDTSGNLLVGTTDTSVWNNGAGGNTGTVIESDGTIQLAKSNNATAYFNRLDSDGDIVSFRKNGSSVGSISSYSSGLDIAGSSYGVRFAGSTIFPVTSAGSVSNGAVDLGYSGGRFKNLHLSGTGYFGTSVGIGITPSSPLHVKVGTNQNLEVDSEGSELRLSAVNDARSANPAMRFQAESYKFYGASGVGPRATIDASGNLLVATTDTTLLNNTSGGGFSVSSNGFTQIAKQGVDNADPVLILNQTGLDGEILRFYKDGGIVGSIGSNSDALYISSPYGNDSGLRFVSGIIAPATTTGANRDAAIDLGYSSGRFKDLYLSGSVTASSVKLSGLQTEVLGVSSGKLLVGAVNDDDFITKIVGHGDSSSMEFNDGTINAVGSTTINHAKSSATNPVLSVKNTSTTNEGRYLQFLGSTGTNIGQIGHVDQTESNIFIATFSTGLKFESYITYKAILPCNENGADSDNAIDLGSSSVRFDDIYATNGTIQTSDRNLKQDIQALTDAEQRVATACKGLIRRFRWQDSVAEKDDNSDSDETARYHFGVIAQDLQDAFTAEGLNASDYGMFISSTWEDDDGVEQTRLGVRYNELLSFIITTI